MERVDENTQRIDANTGRIADSAREIDANTGQIADSVERVDANTRQIDANTGRIADSAGRIDANTGQIADSVGRVDENTQRIDASLLGIGANTRDIARSSSETALHTALLLPLVVSARPASDGPSPSDPDAGSPSVVSDVTDLGVCRADLRVRAGQSCAWTNSVRRFVVTDSGAYSPWDVPWSSELNRDTIKVDEGSPLTGTTFQARQIEPGVWTVLVASAWVHRGKCLEGLIVQPGDLCTESRSQQPFLVYATDESVLGDDRPLYPDGYGVLFWWRGGETPHPDNGRLHDRIVTSDDYFRAERLTDSASWRIARAD